MKQIDLKDQYFGTEIEMTGISRYNAAAAVGRMFGTEPYHIRSYDSWCVKDSDGKTWKFSRDSSIDCERLANGTVIDADGDYSTEMVSPKLEYSEMGKLRKWCGVSKTQVLLSIHPVVCMSMWTHPIIHQGV